MKHTSLFTECEFQILTVEQCEEKGYTGKEERTPKSRRTS